MADDRVLAENVNTELEPVLKSGNGWIGSYWLSDPPTSLPAGTQNV
jgi:hypothetical protein